MNTTAYDITNLTADVRSRMHDILMDDEHAEIPAPLFGIAMLEVIMELLTEEPALGDNFLSLSMDDQEDFIRATSATAMNVLITALEGIPAHADS